MSSFRPGDRTGSHLGYSPWCVPVTVHGVRCVVVHPDLREHDVMAWAFLHELRPRQRFAIDRGPAQRRGLSRRRSTLARMQLNHEFKGFPTGHAPLALTDVATQGWRVLDSDLPLPLAAPRQSAPQHNLAWMQDFSRPTRAGHRAARQDHHVARAVRAPDRGRRLGHQLCHGVPGCRGRLARRTTPHHRQPGAAGGRPAGSGQFAADLPGTAGLFPGGLAGPGGRHRGLAPGSTVRA